MSQRTLLELNHDQAHRIASDPGPFLSALDALTRGGYDEGTLLVLGSYGVRWRGQRHHSEGFDITWGCHKVREPHERDCR